MQTQKHYFYKHLIEHPQSKFRMQGYFTLKEMNKYNSRKTTLGTTV